MTRKEIEEVLRRSADRVSLELLPGPEKNACMRLLAIVAEEVRKVAFDEPRNGS